MSVFKENGSWFVRYRDLEGKQREKKAGNTKALALELERKILAERDLKKRFGYTTLKEITFSEWADQYLDICRVRIGQNTYEVRKYIIKKMKESFGNKLLSKLTENDFYEYSLKQICGLSKDYNIYLFLERFGDGDVSTGTKFVPIHQNPIKTDY